MDTSNTYAAALDGLLVVELSHHRSTRWAGRLLAGFGADVVRVERAATTESFARRTVLDADKRSVLLPPEDPRLRPLLDRADIVLMDEHWTERAGLGLDEPGGRVIARISSFGDSGPYAAWCADDFVLSALAGWTHTQGRADEAPLWVGSDHLSHLVGEHTAFGVASALLPAEATGEGQYLDVVAHEVALVSQLHNPSGYAATGRTRQRAGNSLAANWLALPVSDGWVALTGVANWEEFWTVMLATDDPPPNPWLLPDRAAKEQATIALRSRVAHLTKREFFTLGQALKVICAEVVELADVLATPQMLDRQWPQPHPDHPELLLPGPPVRLSEAGWTSSGRAPITVPGDPVPTHVEDLS